MSKLTIGADPEFMLGKKGKLVEANRVIKNRECGFGCDGHAATGELRPGYSESILELMAKIENILQQGDKKLNLSEYIDEMLAGHYKYGRLIGGHVHLSHPGIIRMNKYGAVPYPKHGDMLDFWLCDCLEDLVAPAEERAYRISRNYGKKHGENSDSIRVPTTDRMEYRATGSWLLSPAVAAAYLFTAKAATLWFLNKMPIPITKADRDSLTREDRINLLEDVLIPQTLELEDGDDMRIPADCLVEIIHSHLDWNADFRGAWL